ncbi:VPLPA-CTERM sorting domain-containing protein [Methylomonas sp. 2BW1-5-20]|uniref:VPLPA-CTERM sorting domain-containing protein n=1 Tax=Methylomonas sp. 2BW1-5-20 TaxID=3376686 RepID=UPI00404E2739
MQNSKSNIRAVVIASAFLLSLSATADASVRLSGFLNAGSPTNFGIADLQTYAASHGSAVKTVTVGSDTYTGVSLYSYISSYVAKDSNAKNDILRDYVLANGSSGSTVYAMGNLLGSGFGVANDIIAYSDSNGTLVAPSVIAADGSSVYGLSSLNVGHVAWQGAGAGGISSSFTVGGAVSNPGSYSTANLPGSLTPTTVFTKPDGSSLVVNATTGFTGVSMWDLLVAAGISTDSNILKTSYVIATGSDNYTAVYSMEEIMAAYGNQGDLVAWADGLGTGLGNSGVFRTVVPSDLKGGRYMSNLSSLTVVNAVPLPAAVWMMLTGLVGLAFSSRKRVLVA